MAQPLRVRRLSADGEVTVISERRHQVALRQARDARVHTAALRLSGRSVVVDIPSQTSRTEVGQLPAELAAELRPVLEGLRRDGFSGMCPVTFSVSVAGEVRAHLQLGPPETVLIRNTSAGLAMLEPAVTVTVTGEENHQQELMLYADASSSRVRVAVSLDWCVITSGKYRGQQAVEVRLDGRRVGQLTDAMSRRYEPDVMGAAQRGRQPGCEALVYRGERGMQVELRLPRRADTSRPPAPVVAAQPAPAPRADVPEQPARKSGMPRPVMIAGGVIGVIIFASAVSQGDEDTEPPSDSDTPAVTTTQVVPEPTETTTVKRTRKAVKPKRITTTRTTTQTAVPEPPPEPEPASNCDPNYGPCVPIASDVDCAGGSGNGPAYVQGPVTVTGSDIYDLDSDSDGVGCE